MHKRTERRVFDAHFHVGPYGVQRFGGRSIRPIPEALDSPEACSQHLDVHHIARGVVVPTYLDDPHAAFGYNDLLREALERDQRLIGGLWVSPHPDVQERCKKALALLPSPRIRALKIASNTWAPYSIDPSTWDRAVRKSVEGILASAHEHGLVIHFHTGYLTGAQPLEFAPFMKRYGHYAAYQFVHMGEAIAPVFSFVPRFVDWVADGLDVYTDTSLVPGFGPPWLLEELDRRHLGYDRVLFATDAPWGRFPAELAKIETASLPDAVKQAVLWDNAAALYGRAPS